MDYGTAMHSCEPQVDKEAELFRVDSDSFVLCMTMERSPGGGGMFSPVTRWKSTCTSKKSAGRIIIYNSARVECGAGISKKNPPQGLPFVHFGVLLRVTVSRHLNWCGNYSDTGT